MKYIPTGPQDARWFAQTEPTVGAPFTAIVGVLAGGRARYIEVLPVPSKRVNCAGCIVDGNRRGTCHEMPSCHNITFMENTPETMRQLVMWRLGVQP